MTDGKADWAPGYYTSYGFLAEGRLDTTSETIAEGEVNNRLLESCELAKEQGIEVYTVMFDLNDPGDRSRLPILCQLERTLLRCARRHGTGNRL